MTEKRLTEVIYNSIKGRERSYVRVTELEIQFKKLVEYAISNRDDRPVHRDELVASKLISNAMSGIGYAIDVNVGRDIWELVSEDSQAQWLYPPNSMEGVYIALVNTAQNMAENQCYIEFN